MGKHTKKNGGWDTRISSRSTGIANDRPKTAITPRLVETGATFCCIFSSYGLTRLRVILVFALAGVRIERSKS